MKKWIVLLLAALCMNTALVAEKEKPAIVHQVQNPKALAHLQEGVTKLLSLTEDYIEEAALLSEKYPQEEDSKEFRKVLKAAKPYLDNPALIKAVFPLIHAGCFDGSDYEGDPEELLALQKMIFETEMEENKLWDAYKNDQISAKRYGYQVDLMEEECIEKIVAFCEKSPDVFFSKTLGPLIQRCEDRFEMWDILFGDFGFYYDISFEPPWAVNYLGPAEKAFYRIDTQYNKLFNVIYDLYFSPEALEKLFDN